MKRYYVLNCDLDESIIKITIPSDVELDSRVFVRGELQYFNEELERFDLEEEGIETWLMDEPDFLKLGDFVLFSDGLKDLLDDAEVENLFYKPIFLRMPKLELDETVEEDEEFLDYHLPATKPIEAVIWNQSEFESVGTEGQKKLTGKFFIEPQKIGNFKIFRLKNVTNNFWIVDEDLKNYLEEAMLIGLSMIETSQYEGEVK